MACVREILEAGADCDALDSENYHSAHRSGMKQIVQNTIDISVGHDLQCTVYMHEQALLQSNSVFLSSHILIPNEGRMLGELKDISVGS